MSRSFTARNEGQRKCADENTDYTTRTVQLQLGLFAYTTRTVQLQVCFFAFSAITTAQRKVHTWASMRFQCFASYCSSNAFRLPPMLSYFCCPSNAWGNSVSRSGSFVFKLFFVFPDPEVLFSNCSSCTLVCLFWSIEGAKKSVKRREQTHLLVWSIEGAKKSVKRHEQTHLLRTCVLFCEQECLPF